MNIGELDTNPEYLSRLHNQAKVRQLLVSVMDRHQLDALIYPVKSLPAPKIGSSDDGPRDNNISAITGLPAIVVPAGMTPEGLPIALEIIGRAFSEPQLIAIADGYERVSHARIAPSTTPHLTGEVFQF
jgi:amidase